MQLITNEYRKLNETLHNRNEYFGTKGHIYADDVLYLAGQYKTTDILDYGCGKNTLANSLPFTINKYDPAIRAFSDDPEPADIVVCTDVMEHIEPDCLDNVLEHIRKKTKKVAYLSISTRLARKTLADGRNAHLIVKKPDWWFARINQYFDINKMTVAGENVIFIVELKKPETQGNTHEQ